MACAGPARRLVPRRATMETRGESIVIRPATSHDASGVARIYNHYVSTTIVTFEEDEVSSSEMARRIEDAATATLPWLVAERESKIVGYAYAAKWRGRPGYRFSTEVTVYVDPSYGRLGIGSRLYEELLARLKAQGIRVAIGGIALPNEASVALHEKCGFSKVAHFKGVGFKFNRWIDVGYWQRTLQAG
jgi:L-amino acid N-acyltransferase YncA